MARLTANGTRSQIGAFNLSERDRVTHRKWARAMLVAYSAVIIALLAAGFVTRHSDEAQTARRSQPVGFNAPTERPITRLGEASNVRRIYHDFASLD